MDADGDDARDDDASDDARDDGTTTRDDDDASDGDDDDDRGGKPRARARGRDERARGRRASRARVARWRFRGTKSCRFIFELETRREWECEYKEGLARRRRRIERGIREFLSDALGGRRCGREGGPGVGTAQ